MFVDFSHHTQLIHRNQLIIKPCVGLRFEDALQSWNYSCMSLVDSFGLQEVKQKIKQE